ncbi:4Fe-4S binding domain-containing protein [Tangfeifania diversioriginum]|uniref:4Fe-4S binding domain-containing protein n=1 Tax=Tangfeifania diversioriginum TaxID=1168035 RepID=A0A1M6P3A3_9BACT|nr:4Fe-4S binding protein [Tangfeifania diversioriginum]SHK02398.1 4Fe-4S binding domain-containing protein [Tangfeifania diversioriginum]
MKKIKYILYLLIFAFYLLPSHLSAQQQRFPKPEFESGYEQPSTVTPEPRALSLEYFDVLVLLAVLSLVTWLILKKRSRQGVLWVSIFTLIYFGFYRNGCICPIGAIQNVTLSFADPAYAISLTALLFFLFPLVFTLFFGRTFCAGACPLGAIQDLIIIKPISLPKWLNKTLGLIPYIYLSLAVLFAATGTDFIICRYDPFVGIFRMDAKFLMVVLGISFLLVGMFVARPYCRFFCPYSVLLSWMSRFSKRHLTITPSKCIQCKLCSNSCPFDAIDYPTDEKEVVKSGLGPKRFITYALLIPLWIAAGVFVGERSHTFLSKANNDVYLAELLISNPEIKNDPDNIDVQTFLASGKTMETLVEEAGGIRQKFYYGSMIAGGFIGLVIGVTLLNTVVFRKRQDYVPQKGNCLSCGRCMDYCPVEE